MTTSIRTATYDEFRDAATVITTLAADSTWHDLHGLVMMSDWHRATVAGLGGSFDVDNPRHVAQLSERAARYATIRTAETFAGRQAVTVTLRSSDDSPIMWRYEVAATARVTVSRLLQIDGSSTVRSVDAITFDSGGQAYTVPAAAVRVYPTGSVFV